MTDKPDKSLEEYLDGGSSVSRGYAELGRTGPPAALDRTILSAAREAVAREEDATVIRVRRWRKWSVSAALAATVVVAVPLVVRVVDLRIDEPPERYATADTRDAGAPAEVQPDAGLVDATQLPAGFAPPPESPAAVTAPDEFAKRLAAQEMRADEDARLRAESVGEAEPDAATTRPMRPASVKPEPNAAAEAQRLARRELSDAGELSDPAAPAAPALADADMATDLFEFTDKAAMNARVARVVADDTASEQAVSGAGARGDYLAPQRFLERISGLYPDDPLAAKRELGEFLLMYPDADLPEGFPLARADAVYPQRRIVQAADAWLRDIAGLAYEGRIDAARQQLARFFERYPDYELPGWFPLTPDDAAPIER